MPISTTNAVKTTLFANWSTYRRAYKTQRQQKKIAPGNVINGKTGPYAERNFSFAGRASPVHSSTMKRHHQPPEPAV